MAGPLPFDPDTPIPSAVAQGSLPAEYQSVIDAARRKQLLSQLLARQAFTPRPTEMVGNYAIKQSPLSGIARGLMGYAAINQGEGAEQDIRGAQEKYQADQSSELNRLSQLSPDEAIRQGSGSRFAMVQALMKDTRARQEKLHEAQAGVLKDTDPAAALRALQGNVPPNWQQPAVPQPTFGSDPAGNPYAIQTNRKGEPDLKYAPKESTTTNNVEVKLPNEEAKTGLEIMKTGVEARQKKANAAVETLNASRSALTALSEGARAGGGEVTKQFLRKATQGLGINLPDTASTEELSMALGKSVIAALASVRPASDRDVTFLQQIQGSIGSDPTALARLLATASSIATKDLQDYSSYIDAAKAGQTSPYAKPYLDAEKIGYGVPNPAGGTSDQLRMLQELQSRGGDVSQFAVGGEPVPPDAKFDIRGPFNSAAISGKVPLTVDQLSPKQKAALRKMLGN